MAFLLSKRGNTRCRPPKKWKIRFMLTPFPLSDLTAFPQQHTLPPPDPDSSLDQSASLQALLTEQTSPKTYPWLKNMRVVLVPSMLSDLIRWIPNGPLLDYFGHQKKWLEDQGADVVWAPVNTQSSMEENATRLLHMLAQDHRPTGIIGHSKGGVDSLHALLHASPGLLDSVMFWLPLHSPFFGSPLADHAHSHAYDLAGACLTWFGGSPQCLTDLTTSIRHHYIKTYLSDIEALTTKIPSFCISATLDDPRAHILEKGGALYFNILNGAALPSDGIVATHSALLPTSPYAILPGYNHAEVVYRFLLPSHGRHVRFLSGLLSLVEPACLKKLKG